MKKRLFGVMITLAIFMVFTSCRTKELAEKYPTQEYPIIMTYDTGRLLGKVHFSVIEIDGCEYIIGRRLGSDEILFLPKGNCKNPIHQYSRHHDQ
jgi:hypothetical protein